MMKTLSLLLRHSLTIVATAGLLAACADNAPVAPKEQLALRARHTTVPPAEADAAIATLRRVTDRYHDLDAAIADGFVFLHGCEDRPGEGPVGTVYINIARLIDGVIDPGAPDGLIYEPGINGRPKLVAVEFAIPYSLWSGQEPPQFLGAAFQREDEFGVFGLHVWAWRENPAGLFAETNPKVSCGVE
jgi:hypothetical protein